MDHDELVEAGAEAIKPALLTYAQALARPSPIHLAQVMIHAVEPLIRADERERGAHTRQEGWLNTESHRKAVLADVRAGVLSLRTTWPRGSTGGQLASNLYIAETGTVRVADVLALLDGGSDE